MEFLKELNREQFDAVITKERKVLVIAGAGSGKTKVLTTRIKYLLSIGVPNTAITAFTFTKKAAGEMKYRLKDYDFEQVYTFHSFCYEKLQDVKEELGFKKNMNVVKEDYEEKLIKEILDNMQLDINPSKIRDYISKRKNGVAYQFKDTKEGILYDDIFYRFQGVLSQRGFIDFDDMVHMLVNNLDNISTKEDILNQCQYILVDECQDTNQIQYQLINKLASKYGNIFMVGDDDQLVYSFRPSDIRIINGFKNTANQVIVLNQNYRSAANILDAANHLISFNSGRNEKQLFSKIEKKYELEYYRFPDTSFEAMYVVSEIEQKIKGEYKPTDIAVLYRNNNQSEEMELELKKRNIKYYVYGKKAFYEYTECKRMIAAYRFLDNPEDTILFREAVIIDQQFYDHMVNEYKTSGKSFLDSAETSRSKIISSAAKAFKEFLEIRTVTNKTIFFERIKELLFKNDIVQRESRHLQTLKNIIISHIEQDECELFNEIMMMHDDKENSTGVHLMTIHKSKGLEFKCVYIISINDGILPSSKASIDQLEEERRLFYVAITRAKEALMLSSTDSMITNGKRKSYRPSVFLSEVKPAPYISCIKSMSQ